MITQSQIKLLALIWKNTQTGKMAWSESVSAYTFQSVMSSGVIRVGRYETSPPFIKFEIMDSVGRVVDTFTDDDLKDSGHKTFDRDTWWELCQELYEIARRSALGAEKVILGLIDDLEDPLPF